MAKRGSLTNPLDVERLIDPVLEPKFELVHMAWKRLGAIFILQTYKSQESSHPAVEAPERTLSKLCRKKERVNQRD